MRRSPNDARILRIHCRCGWSAIPPDGWEAPFAICPGCDARIPNPHAPARVETAADAGDKKPRRMPRGYTFEERPPSRGLDALIRVAAALAVVGCAIGGIFYLTAKKSGSSLRTGPEPQGAGSVLAASPFDPETEGAAAAKPGNLPPLEWNSGSVFSLETDKTDGGIKLWDDSVSEEATQSPDDPLADPRLTLDGLE